MIRFVLIAVIRMMFVLSTEFHHFYNYELCINRYQKRPSCVKKENKDFSFFYDNFSSEGAEGKVIFDNDSLINQITFSYATGMVLIQQEYQFKENKLTKFTHAINYINQDKSGYSNTYKFSVYGAEIFKSKYFNDTLMLKLLKTAEDKNPCWKKKQN